MLRRRAVATAGATPALGREAGTEGTATADRGLAEVAKDATDAAEPRAEVGQEEVEREEEVEEHSGGTATAGAPVDEQSAEAAATAPAVPTRPASPSRRSVAGAGRCNLRDPLLEIFTLKRCARVYVEFSPSGRKEVVEIQAPPQLSMRQPGEAADKLLELRGSTAKGEESQLTFGIRLPKTPEGERGRLVLGCTVLDIDAIGGESVSLAVPALKLMKWLASPHPAPAGWPATKEAAQENATWPLAWDVLGLLLLLTVWIVGCVIYSGIGSIADGLEGPMVLEAQLQLDLGKIPVPEDSPLYQQYYQYYMDEHKRRLDQAESAPSKGMGLSFSAPRINHQVLKQSLSNSSWILFIIVSYIGLRVVRSIEDLDHSWCGWFRGLIEDSAQDDAIAGGAMRRGGVSSEATARIEGTAGVHAAEGGHLDGEATFAVEDSDAAIQPSLGTAGMGQEPSAGYATQASFPFIQEGPDGEPTVVTLPFPQSRLAVDAAEKLSQPPRIDYGASPQRQKLQRKIAARERGQQQQRASPAVAGATAAGTSADNEQPTTLSAAAAPPSSPGDGKVDPLCSEVELEALLRELEDTPKVTKKKRQATNRQPAQNGARSPKHAASTPLAGAEQAAQGPEEALPEVVPEPLPEPLPMPLPAPEEAQLPATPSVAPEAAKRSRQRTPQQVAGPKSPARAAKAQVPASASQVLEVASEPSKSSVEVPGTGKAELPEPQHVRKPKAAAPGSPPGAAARGCGREEVRTDRAEVAKAPPVSRQAAERVKATEACNGSSGRPRAPTEMVSSSTSTKAEGTEAELAGGTWDIALSRSAKRRTKSACEGGPAPDSAPPSSLTLPASPSSGTAGAPATAPAPASPSSIGRLADSVASGAAAPSATSSSSPARAAGRGKAASMRTGLSEGDAWAQPAPVDMDKATSSDPMLEELEQMKHHDLIRWFHANSADAWLKERLNGTESLESATKSVLLRHAKVLLDSVQGAVASAATTGAEKAVAASGGPAAAEPSTADTAMSVATTSGSNELPRPIRFGNFDDEPPHSAPPTAVAAARPISSAGLGDDAVSADLLPSREQAEIWDPAGLGLETPLQAVQQQQLLQQQSVLLMQPGLAQHMALVQQHMPGTAPTQLSYVSGAGCVQATHLPGQQLVPVMFVPMNQADSASGKLMKVVPVVGDYGGGLQIPTISSSDCTQVDSSMQLLQGVQMMPMPIATSSGDYSGTIPGTMASGGHLSYATWSTGTMIGSGDEAAIGPQA